MGLMQFLTNATNSQLFTQQVNRSLNWLSYREESLYHLRFLAADQVLLKDGEEGKFVYILRSGRLKAIKTVEGKEVALGFVEPGEFVGEMAYINGEPRSADVVSMTDCELIEIPSGCLDSVLFSKPAWSKSLMKTLSKRLKQSNLKSF
jgi:CRP-like cAMP-binding protein